MVINCPLMIKLVVIEIESSLLNQNQTHNLMLILLLPRILVVIEKFCRILDIDRSGRATKRNEISVDIEGFEQLKVTSLGVLISMK